MYLDNRTSQVKLFIKNSYAVSASFIAYSLFSNKQFIASTKLCGSFGGTSKPVFPCVTISGIPPTLVATTGTLRKNASLITFGILSILEGKTRTLEDFKIDIAFFHSILVDRKSTRLNSSH